MFPPERLNVADIATTDYNDPVDQFPRKRSEVTHSVSVAEAKRRFSELVNRASTGEERFLIERRGAPVGAIVSPRDLAHLAEAERGPRPHGLLAAVGALAEVEDLDEILAEIQRQRRQATDREVSLE